MCLPCNKKIYIFLDIFLCKEHVDSYIFKFDKQITLSFTGDCEVSPNILNRRFSDDLHELSAICLFWNAYDRPCAYEIPTHPIFKTLKKTLPLPELLKPAMPLSDRVGYDTGKENYYFSLRICYKQSINFLRVHRPF